MSDRQLIADLLSALEYHTEQTRPIEFSKVAIEAAREYLSKPAQPQPEPDWDWRHPKAQSLIGAKARLEIKLRLVEQLVEDPNFETTASDMEYWEPLHDKLQGRLAQPEREPVAHCEAGPEHCPVCLKELSSAQQKPAAKVELMTSGGNAGLATRIVEIDDHLRERLRPGQLLYTAPPQRKPLTDEDTVALIKQCRDAFAEELGAWDIEPPIHHVQQGYDNCVNWLAAHGIKGEA